MRPITCLVSVALFVLLASLGTLVEAQNAPKKVEFGKNVFLEIDGDKRRVVVNAYVCLRQGQLEQLVTRKRTKEHEAILAIDADARHVHAALLAAGAVAGSPVKFRPKFEVPSGTTIKITLEYKEKGKTVRLHAQQWIRNIKSKKDLDTDWVFAGSVLIPNPFEKNKDPFYGANDGDVHATSRIGLIHGLLPFNRIRYKWRSKS